MFVSLLVFHSSLSLAVEVVEWFRPAGADPLSGTVAIFFLLLLVAAGVVVLELVEQCVVGVFFFVANDRSLRQERCC